MSCVSQVKQLLANSDNWVVYEDGVDIWQNRSGEYSISAWYDHINFYRIGVSEPIDRIYPCDSGYNKALKMYIKDPRKYVIYLHNKELEEAIERLG